MSRQRRDSLPNEDIVLLDYARRLNKFRTGRHAVHIFVSRLRAHNRREHHLRIVASTFEPLIRRFDGALFHLYNQDMVVICNGAKVSDIDDCVLRVRYLFSEDPLFKQDEEDVDPFCTWYDMEQDYPRFLAFAEKNADERTRYDAQKAAQSQEQERVKQHDLPPMDALSLASLIRSIQNADLSSMLRRQPVCAVIANEKPHILFNELYIAIDALHQLLMPTHDLKGNRWLFRELCRHLDLRMMAILGTSNDEALKRAFSLNLDLETLVSDSFLEFDAALNTASRRTIVIEVQAHEVLSDMTNYAFAREFLRDRGYRICLDGVDHLSLPMIDRELLGVDLVKLEWNDNLVGLADDADAARLTKAIRALTPDRLILHHCASAQSLEFGRSVGITMYQGFLIDHLLKDTSTRQDTVQALTEARARQRAATRALDRAS